MSFLSTQTDILGALYTDLSQAREVASGLSKAGVSPTDISVLSDGSQFPDAAFPEVDGSMLDQSGSAVEDATEVGAVIGGTGGMLAGFSSLIIPGVGPLLVLGTVLISALAGMSVGAMAGGAVGIFTQLGFPEEEAEDLASRMNKGEVLVLARVEDQNADTIRGIMLAHQPTEMMGKELIWKR